MSECRRRARSYVKLPAAISLGLAAITGDTRQKIAGRCNARARSAYSPQPDPPIPWAAAGPQNAILAAFCRKIFYRGAIELIISTKAGYTMRDGPGGYPGSSRKYLIASLDQSLRNVWGWSMSTSFGITIVPIPKRRHRRCVRITLKPWQSVVRVISSNYPADIQLGIVTIFWSDPHAFCLIFISS